VKRHDYLISFPYMWPEIVFMLLDYLWLSYFFPVQWQEGSVLLFLY